MVIDEGETKRTPTREQVRDALITSGNERLYQMRCEIHGERAHLITGAAPTNIVIDGCCYSYVSSQAAAIGFRN